MTRTLVLLAALLAFLSVLSLASLLGPIVNVTLAFALAIAFTLWIVP